MTAPRALALGGWVRFDDEDHQVIGFTGTGVRLRSVCGRAQIVLVGDLLARQEMKRIEAPSTTAPDGWGDGAGLDQGAFVEALPPDELARVRDLEAHLLEVITGYHGGAPAGDEPPNPHYAPAVDLTAKVRWKVEELASTRHACSERQLWRNYTSYRDHGAWGLVNRNKVRVNDPLAGLDRRIREAILEQALIEVEDSSAGGARFFNRVERRLAALYGAEAPPLPRDRTFRRRVNELLHKQHPSKPADQRRNVANQPAGQHGHFHASRPGQVVMMDSTRLDILAYDPVTGCTLPLELTIAIDLYTRGLVAWRLTPLGANAVDAVMLLADMLTPEAMRPGWAEHLRYAYYGVHVERAFSLDERLVAAAGRPVIWPEIIVVDNGKIYVSDALKRGCAAFGITLQFARLDKPTDKPEVERAFGTIRSQFAEHVAGYKGRNVSHRGPDVEGTARWTIDQIEEFFAEYVVAVYQRRPHSGLHVPGARTVAMSPNDMYAEGVAVAGVIPVPADSPYLELLPIEWRQIHNYGVQLDYLIYDGEGLNGLRGVPSPYPHGNGLWPIRKDPRNRLQVFFKHPHTGTWHALKWVQAENWLEPFTDRTIAYVLDTLADRGRKHPLAEEVAQELRDLQRRMDAPEAATAKDRRRVTRDRARVQSTLRDQARVTGADECVAPLHAVADTLETTEAEEAFDISKLTAFGVYSNDDDGPGSVPDSSTSATN